eukprot:TRINITY_DN296_c2_g1_i1.p1 TRINITY_DN296_c2_g1~~TRINITY_DN296_c2_g1_i1.p1  ORF type:complete len:294 (-),score=99.80 TRINITY_DN296_c2_g1_i1:77-958(-)
MLDSYPAVQDTVAASIAGMSAKIVEFPLDTIKVRLQSQSFNFKGPMDACVQTFRNEGFFAFYQGLSAPLFGAALEATMLFVCYQKAANLLTGGKGTRDDLNMGQVLVAGTLAGIGTATVLTPVELIKCRLQVQQETKSVTSAAKSAANSKGPIDVIKKAIKTDGITGLYRGFTSTLLRELPANAAWFGAYEGFARFFGSCKNASEAPMYIQLMAGGLAGMFYWGVPYPIDTVKSELQTMKNPESFQKVCARIYKNHGIKGFYKGCLLTCVRAIPGNAVIFFAYEQILSYLQTH